MIDKVIVYAKTLQPLLKWIKDNPDDKEINSNNFDIVFDSVGLEA